MVVRQVDLVYVNVVEEFMSCRPSIFIGCYVVIGPLIDLSTLYFSNNIVCFMEFNIRNEMKWVHFEMKWMRFQQVECV